MDPAELSTLDEPTNVQLWTDSGGCLPAHACILELHSPLLQQGLQLAGKNQLPGQELLLQVPGVKTEDLESLLLALNSSSILEYLRDMSHDDLAVLEAVATAASLLRCSDAVRLAETAFIKNSIVDAENLVPISIWAHQLNLFRLGEYCAHLFLTLSLDDKAAKLLRLRCSVERLGNMARVAAQLYRMVNSTGDAESEGRKQITASMDAAAYAAKVSWLR